MKYRITISRYSRINENLIYEVPFNIDSEELKDLYVYEILELLEKDYEPIEIIETDSDEDFELYDNKEIKK
jgi:hypothetical protein